MVNPAPDIRCSGRVQSALFYPIMVFTVMVLKILVLVLCHWSNGPDVEGTTVLGNMGNYWPDTVSHPASLYSLFYFIYETFTAVSTIVIDCTAVVSQTLKHNLKNIHVFTVHK